MATLSPETVSSPSLRLPCAPVPPPCPPPIKADDPGSVVPTSHLYLREAMNLNEEVEYLLQPFLADRYNVSGENAVVTFVQDINPVIQDGPMCGLVALSMASQLLWMNRTALPTKCHPETLLGFAKENGFCKQGEMLSVDYMLQTAEQQMNCCGRSTYFDSLHIDVLMRSILGGREAILVPYDADKDHSPCLERGHRAHWCVIVGFAVALNRETCIQEGLQLIEYCTPNPRLSGHYELKKELGLDFAKWFSLSEENYKVSTEPVGELYLFARQGKSRHIGLWKYRELLQSNRNLVEVGLSMTCSGDYVIPDGGIKEGLCSKVLVLSRKSTQLPL